MTTELTKAAQQALEQLEFLNACYPHKPAADAIVSLQSALTQRPAAQTEREAFEAWARPNGYDLRRNDVLGHYSSIDTSRAWDGFRAGRASLTAPQQATPEPVGEAWGWAVNSTLFRGEFAEDDAKAEAKRCGGTTSAVALYTRPAPGVPELLPAVLTDWGFDVHDDEEGRTWLTIRNPDDDVARMSVPTVWPLNGNQTISAVVLHQFSAALTSALAAAQAKGGEA